MKKLFMFLMVLFLVSGCGENNSAKTFSCSSVDENNGLTTNTKYDFKYVDDEIKHVTITYDYNQDTNNDDTMDGVDADTDGLNEDEDTTNNDGSLDSDEVVDGVVGDAIDETVGTVTDTILDIAGIRTTFENQFAALDGIEGFSYDVDVDDDNKYRVIYEIDMDKISDDNLARFDVDRSFNTTRDDYEDLGFTCK